MSRRDWELVAADALDGGGDARPAEGEEAGGRLALRLDHRQGAFHLAAELDAEPGILVLFGPSGSGKTTLLNCVAGVTRPTAGEVLLDGVPVFRSRGTGRAGTSDSEVDVPLHHRKVAVVFQDYSLFPHLTVMQNVVFGLQGSEREVRRARDLLAMCRLVGLEDRYPAQLSGGQQQRVALARALATKPRVLLLDEPFSALDSNVREKLQTDLLRLQRRLGLTIIHVTHDLREALVLADRIAVMDEGRIIQVGGKDEVLRHPASEAVARFMGTRNIMDGVVAGISGKEMLVEVAGVQLRAPALGLPKGAGVQVFIRPEEIVPVWDDAPCSERGTLVEGRALAEIDRGLVWRIYLRCEALELVVDVPAHDYDFHREALRRRLGEARWAVLVPRDSIQVVAR